MTLFDFIEMFKEPENAVKILKVKDQNEWKIVGVFSTETALIEWIREHKEIHGKPLEMTTSLMFSD